MITIKNKIKVKAFESFLVNSCMANGEFSEFQEAKSHYKELVEEVVSQLTQQLNNNFLQIVQDKNSYDKEFVFTVSFQIQE